jgi:hypothetical protein
MEKGRERARGRKEKRKEEKPDEALQKKSAFCDIF